MSSRAPSMGSTVFRTTITIGVVIFQLAMFFNYLKVLIFVFGKVFLLFIICMLTFTIIKAFIFILRQIYQSIPQRITQNDLASFADFKESFDINQLSYQFQDYIQNSSSRLNSSQMRIKINDQHSENNWSYILSNSQKIYCYKLQITRWLFKSNKVISSLCSVKMLNLRELRIHSYFLIKFQCIQLLQCPFLNELDLSRNRITSIKSFRKTQFLKLMHLNMMKNNIIELESMSQVYKPYLEIFNEMNTNKTDIFEHIERNNHFNIFPCEQKIQRKGFIKSQSLNLILIGKQQKRMI